MASTDARPVPRKNTAFRYYFTIRKNDGTLITSWAGADSEVSLDGASFSDCTNEATEIGTTGCGYIDFTSSEMNGDAVMYKLTVTNTSALPVVVTFFPEEVGDYRVNVEQFGGSSGTFSGGRPEVNTSHWGGTAVASTEVRANLINIAGSAVSTSTAQLGVNVVNAAGTAWGSGAITAASIASNAITSAKIATDAIGAAQLAADAVTEIQSGLATAAAIAALNNLSSADVSAAVWNAATASYGTAGSYGETVEALTTATGEAAIRTAVGLASANLDTQLGDLPTANENADALLGRNVAGGSSTGRLVKEALYFLRNKWTISGGTMTVYATDDSTSSWTATITTTAGNPVTASDPA